MVTSSLCSLRTPSCLFYSPLGASDSVMPAGGASAATPAFAYTYQLTGTPAVRPEYYIRERRVVRAEITVERASEHHWLGCFRCIWFRFLCELTYSLDFSANTNS